MEKIGLIIGGPIKINHNGQIYARLVNNQYEEVCYATENIENIDKLEPNIFVPIATSTPHSITVTGDATDAEKTDKNGCSGISKYYFSKDNGQTWEPPEGQTENSYTFNNLENETNYKVKMKAVDNAGNEVVTETVNQETKSLKNLKAGDYVKYNSGANGIITCRVLYPLSSAYGLQIISNQNVKNVTIGSTNSNTARTNYENAITQLNNEALNYKNATYATDARCVGSNPANKNSEVAGPTTLTFTYNGSNKINLKNTDNNYQTDLNTMKSVNIAGTQEYWLASRHARGTSIWFGFGMRVGSNVSNGAEIGIYHVYPNGRSDIR